MTIEGQTIRFRDRTTGLACSFQGRALTVPQGFNVEGVKVGYAREVMRASASRYGFSVRQVETPKEKVKLW